MQNKRKIAVLTTGQERLFGTFEGSNEELESGRPIKLKDVWEFVSQIQGTKDKEGRPIGFGRVAFLLPVFGVNPLKEVIVTPCMTYDVEACGLEKDFGELLENAENGLRAARAQAAGLVLPGSNGAPRKG